MPVSKNTVRQIKNLYQLASLKIKKLKRKRTETIVKSIEKGEQKQMEDLRKRLGI